MRLDAYLKARGLSYREFAARVGGDAAQVHRWATGKRLPSLIQAATIEKETEGQVTSSDFLSPAERAA